MPWKQQQEVLTPRTAPFAASLSTNCEPNAHIPTMASVPYFYPVTTTLQSMLATHRQPNKGEDGLVPRQTSPNYLTQADVPIKLSQW